MTREVCPKSESGKLRGTFELRSANCEGYGHKRVITLTNLAIH